MYHARNNLLWFETSDLGQRVLSPTAIVSYEEWRRREAGLSTIGEIDFTSLRPNFRRICKALASVDRAGYFD